MVDKPEDADDIGKAPSDGPPEPDEKSDEEPAEERDERAPEAFYVWKNEGGAHLPGD